MSAEEADARFAALVSQYREHKKPRRKRIPRPSWNASIGLALVYALGVTVGAVWHVKAVGLIVLGIPAILVARALLLRWYNDGSHDD